jgi:hypothetical protein
MIKKFYKEFEQAILFYSLVTYLIGFMFYFDNEMRTTDWMGPLWIIQFFTLGTLLGLYSRTKNWRWPKRY